VVDIAKVSTLDLLLDKLNVLPASPVEDDAKNALRAACCIDDPLTLRGSRRQRFFDHDVFSGFQRR
jgi:hypothetical protein